MSSLADNKQLTRFSVLYLYHNSKAHFPKFLLKNKQGDKSCPELNLDGVHAKKLLVKI